MVVGEGGRGGQEGVGEWDGLKGWYECSLTLRRVGWGVVGVGVGVGKGLVEVGVCVKPYL